MQELSSDSWKIRVGEEEKKKTRHASISGLKQQGVSETADPDTQPQWPDNKELRDPKTNRIRRAEKVFGQV